jgi:hypothetical protein
MDRNSGENTDLNKSKNDKGEEDRLREVTGPKKQFLS